MSGVSNKTVLQRLDQQPLGIQILKQQLLYLQRVATMPSTSRLRRATFHKEGLTPLTSAYVRKVGRPRQAWAEQLMHIGAQMCGSQQQLEACLQDANAWAAKVREATLMLT